MDRRANNIRKQPPKRKLPMSEIIRDSSVAVGTTAVLLSFQKTEGQRTSLAITNTSTAGQIITLGWGHVPTAGAGIVLSPYGSWSESVDSAFIPSNLEIWAISSAASGTIGIQERIRS
jgi:hypothetical protein